MNYLPHADLLLLCVQIFINQDDSKKATSLALIRVMWISNDFNQCCGSGSGMGIKSASGSGMRIRIQHFKSTWIRTQSRYLEVGN